MHRNRKVSVTGYYHVFMRGINHELIFGQARERNYFKKILHRHLDECDIEIHAYCIMSNHAHFLIKSIEISQLSIYMSKVLAEYAKYYNYKRNRNGHVFQSRFKSECINDESYYWNCMRYIHMNPVKAHMVSTPQEYRYSSFKEFKSKKSMLLHENAYKLCGERFVGWNAYSEFHQEPLKQVFLGMQNEVYLQQKDCAWEIMIELCDNHQKDCLQQVIEENEIREEFMQRICDDIHISVSKMKKIVREIRNELCANK